MVMMIAKNILNISSQFHIFTSSSPPLHNTYKLVKYLNNIYYVITLLIGGPQISMNKLVLYVLERKFAGKSVIYLVGLYFPKILESINEYSVDKTGV